MSITPEVTAKTLTQLVAIEIKVQMARADVRQSQLARKIGKTEQWLSVRLRGRQPIDINDLALIAQGLNVGIHDLLPSRDEAAGAAPDLSLRYGHLTRSSARRGRTSDSAPVGVPASGPFGGGRRDATRPVSAVPAHNRRPMLLSRAARPTPA